MQTFRQNLIVSSLAYLDDIGEGSLLVGVKEKCSEPRPLGPATLSGITKRSDRTAADEHR